MKMIRHLFKGALLGAALFILNSPFAGRAAIANVQVGNGGNIFTPVTTNIFVNDQVLWTFFGAVNHNVTSTNSAWAMSPTQHSPTTFTNTFTAAGTYFYYCTIHGTPTTGMKGAVVVATVGTPPAVTITNPASGTVFAAPANVTIRASASDTGGGGTVTNVQFLVDANIVGNDTVAPYSAVTNNLAAGAHTLSAVAADSNGLKNTNSTAISVVTPVTVVLSAPQPVPTGKFRFTYTANTGLSYIVQRSTNLLSANWTTLVTNLAGSGSINYTDLNTTVKLEFYRVGRLPNP